MASVVADLLTYLVSTHAREHQVQHDQVDGLRLIFNDLERGSALAGRGYFEAFGFKIKFDSYCQMLFVVDDKNMFGFGIHTSTAGSAAFGFEG